MKISKSVPTLSVYAPNRTTWLGATRQPLELNFEYNFNGCSTLEFEINKYVYDENRFKWVLNPLYDSIKKRNLIYVAHNDEIYSYKTNELFEPSDADVTPATSEYGLKDLTDQPAINASYAGLTYTPQFKGCTLQDETLLFDIGARDGYTWSLATYFGQEYHNDHLYAPGSGFARRAQESNHISDRIATEQYFPIQVGDIIALGCRKQMEGNRYFKKDGYAQYAYLPFFYLSNYASACSHITASDTPTNRYSSSQPTIIYNPMTRLRVSEELLESTAQDNGFVRFEARFLPETTATHDRYWMPNFGYVKIFSGERRMQSLGVSAEKRLIQHGIPWWVISEVTDSKQGMNSKKTVRAYSYEYTLSQRNTSLSEATLPLYIPDVVVDIVRSDDFLYHRIGAVSGSGVTYTNKYGAQRMERGLMNQILDALPGWSIRYLSRGLASKYRSIPEVDNENIYSFLMNTVQKVYNCYFIFDTENRHINILSHDDFLSIASNTGASSGVVLSWRNVLKEVNVGETDDSFITSCRVYSDDATYGIGLVNPNATDNVYNFQGVLPLLDYVVDDLHINPTTSSPYTLRELCEKYMEEYDAEWADIKEALSTAATEYSYAQTSEGYEHPHDTYEYPAQWQLILAVRDLPLLQARRTDALAKFEASVSENNVLANVSQDELKIPLNPFPISEYESGGGWSFLVYSPATGTYVQREGWVDVIHWGTVRDLARAYWEFDTQLKEVQRTIRTCLSNIKASALRYSLDVRALQTLFDANNVDGVPTTGYTPIFTPREAAEMARYVYEGTWTNDKVIFSEEYSPTDIVNTLVDFMDTAKNEMDTLYSKPQYEFDVDFADLPKHSLLSKACEALHLGNALTIDDGEERVNPILLQLKLSYGSGDNAEMGFSTNYKRKPLETRFSDMFATINQVSVTSPQYTYEG